jgi:hypothetical protein
MILIKYKSFDLYLGLGMVTNTCIPCISGEIRRIVAEASIGKTLTKPLFH